MRTLWTVAVTLLFLTACKNDSNTETSIALKKRTETAGIDKPGKILACNSVFAIRRTGDGAVWEGWKDDPENDKVICKAATTADYFFVDTDAAGNVLKRLEWNRKNLPYIDFEASYKPILARHQSTLPNPETYTYQMFKMEDIVKEIGSAYTYDHFLKLFKDDGVVVAKRLPANEYVPGDTGVFSVPAILSAYKTHGGNDLGVYIDNDNAAHLSISDGTKTDYYNISYDPSKSRRF